MSFLCDASHGDSVDGHLRASPSSSHVSTRARVHISLRWDEEKGWEGRKREGRGGEIRSESKRASAGSLDTPRQQVTDVRV